MKLGYIQTFAELTQNKNIVSEQELMAFQNRYNLAEKEMDEIKEHLPENSDEAEFALLDPEKQAQCDEMSQKLNALIPRIHLNLFLSDFMDD